TTAKPNRKVFQVNVINAGLLRVCKKCEKGWPKLPSAKRGKTACKPTKDSGMATRTKRAAMAAHKIYPCFRIDSHRPQYDPYKRAKHHWLTSSTGWSC